MTANGILRGDSRQQVSVTRTGVGASSNPADSQVLGNHLLNKNPNTTHLTAATLALQTDRNNRQLHVEEQKLAKQLAAKSNGKYTEQEVADALRWADNSKLGETTTSNMMVDSKTDAALGNKPNDAVASKPFDPMLPGKSTSASLPYVSDGKGVLVQNMDQVAKPSNDLMAYIQQNSGGSNSPYNWNTAAWQSSPEPRYDNTRYATQTANGQTFSLPLAPCPAGGCSNGDSIAWATTNQKDQQVLAAYKTELDQEAKRATALATGTPVMAAGVALGGIPTAGQIGIGTAIGAGVNYAAQTQLNDGKINTSEVLMGGITGGLTMGRSLIPTVLINTGGSMNTSAYLNDNIGASMTGTAVGSALGWGTGYLVENLAGKITSAFARDRFWQYGKGFSSDLVPLPYGITGPVLTSPWPIIGGATIGAGVQEVSGDAIKNMIKGSQP